jgi:hypothetical protein
MATTLRDLIEKGALEPPLDLERTYKGQRFTARVEEDGSVSFDGERYKSPSVAGAMARAKALKASSYQATNGWIFWHFRDKGGNLVPLDFLRKLPL